MSEKLIGGLTGRPGTGKSTICEHLATEYGFFVIEGSTAIQRAAEEQDVQLTSRHSYDSFFREQQRAHGMSWISDITLSTDRARVLQGGLRSKYDLMNLRHHGGFILALVCPPSECMERIDKTASKNPKTLEEYLAHVELEESDDEYGTHTDWCVANADYTIDTSKPLAETFEEVGALIGELAK